ncbi:MAG: DNA repair protein RecN [Prevotella sp.]|nr:DNA repair protein RecN [Prevotella sp.]
MIKQLFIKNYALIDELNMTFNSGFSVVTGETGAGKSIILGAIGLLLGQRADSKTVKMGAAKCVIEAHFDLSRYGMEDFFEQNDIEYDAADTIVRRELTAAGKSRAFINDTPAPLTLLKELGERLVDVHSQHQNLLLNKQDFQLNVVDIIADDGSELEAYQQVYASYQATRQRLETLKADIERARQNADFLQFQADELADARLADGEQEELEQRSDTMAHAEDIKSALYQADNILTADDRGVVARLRTAAAQLRSIERVLPDAKELADRLETCHIELKDVAAEVSRRLEDVDFDPAEQETVNNRLDRIYDLEKKYRVDSVAQLLDILTDLQRQLSAVENSDEALAELQQQLALAERLCHERAAVLTAKRQAAAKEIERQMGERLVTLGMPNVRFQTAISQEPLSRRGQDKVSFLFSANTSTPLQPVSQVASGGEIARVMLALKVMISGAVKLPTIIFDEIDTGVSGKTAEQMARMMDEMGRLDRQVISITHLPQIAAMGKTHYKVFKEETPQGTVSRMVMLGADERVREIAQMLSGSSVTEAAIQNAKALLRPLLTCLFVLLSFAAAGTAAAQSWVKKTSKAVFTLKTFDDGGTLLSSANGIFVGTGGEAISCYAPFKGASRAVVIDASGKESEVECMLGANETYDVAKFRVSLSKTVPIPLAASRQDAGGQLWLQPYLQPKNIVQGTIRKVETFGQHYGYYTVKVQQPSFNVFLPGTPLINEAGEAVGLMQPGQQTDTLVYAVSALFADSLTLSGLSINDPALRAIHIKKALPADINQALLTLYVGSAQMDSAAYASLVNQFIEQFPKSPDGYVYRAQLAADGGNYAAADRDMETALKTGEKPDETHYSYSRMVWQKMLVRPQDDYAPWSLDKALDEAREAYRLNAQPTYRHQQATVLFAQKKYADAAAVYDELFTSQLRSPDIFYEASRCQALAGDTARRLALLDSCLSLFNRPYLKEAAPYILARAQARMDTGRNREAVTDLNDYEQLMAAQVNDQFYYLRFRAELAGRLFQQALNDIAKAIELNPQSDLYYAEKASLEVRVGLYDEAMATAQECIRIAPDHSDGYLFLGLAQCLKGQKAEGVKNLRKAGEMGDPQAEGLIEKYSK